MGRLKPLALLGAVMLLAPAAGVLAADYVKPKPIGHAWYLRGHIGLAAQNVGSLYNSLYDTTDIVDVLSPIEFDGAPTFGVGVGFYARDNLRIDFTGEYRSKASFSALEAYETTDDGDPATYDGTDEYTGRKSEFLFLANAYWDFAQWGRMTPYIGGGIGVSRNTIWNFTDINTPNAGVAYGATDSKWNLAWALHAGLSMRASDRMAVELGYSFVHLGDAQSGDLIDYLGGNATYNPMIFNNLTSHDLKVAVRWDLDKGAY